MTGQRDSSTDDLWRWLIGGLLGGGILLGLLIAAYAIGSSRGHEGSAPTAHGEPVASTASPPIAPKPVAIGAVTVTPELVARGKTLYGTLGCSGCHSLTGAAGSGPSFKDLAGGMSALASRRLVTADDAYLARSISDPDAQVVKGYRAGLMSAAIAGFDLPRKPDDIRALVAFIKSEK
jgi:mono/diheme cytochrome c family protein